VSRLQHTTTTEKVKADTALHGNPISELRDVTCHMGSHSVTCHPTQVNAPRLTPAMQVGTRFTYPRGMEGWVDLVDLIAPRPGVESATFWSRVWRRTAVPPTCTKTTNHLILDLSQWVFSGNHLHLYPPAHHKWSDVVYRGEGKSENLSLYTASVQFASDTKVIGQNH